MSKHRFEIEFPQMHGRHGRVLMDGQEVKGVTDVSIVGSVGDVVRLTLTLMPESVLVRLYEPEVVARAKTLLAETTHMGSANKTYVQAVPKDEA